MSAHPADQFRPHMHRLFADVEVRGVASSSWNEGHVHARLAWLNGRTDDEAAREIAYLRDLLRQ